MSFDPIPLIIKQVGLQVDLTKHEKALRELLRDAHEVYEVALEDWYTRADPSKPKGRLEANWADDEDYDPAYDYRDWKDKVFDKDFDKGWKKFWKRFYWRGRGNPGTNRTSSKSTPPPVAPLYPVYHLVRRWWIETTGRKTFRLDYPRDPSKETRTKFNLFNPPGRLFLLIVQELNHNYTASTCYGVQQTAQKKRSNKP